MLELREVVKHFPDPAGGMIRPIDNVSFTVALGQFVAIYGPSGSGKTTLISLMAGLVAPDRGSVLFDDHDLATLSRRAAARYRMYDVGFIAQTSWMVPGMSAADNAALKLFQDARFSRARETVAPLLDRVGLSHRAHHLAGRLSAGERQRVAIVRALSTNPQLVLADEPTGNLDARRSDEIFVLLSELCSEREVGVVLVTHDPQAAQRADRVYVLDDGRLVPKADDELAIPATDSRSDISG